MQRYSYNLNKKNYKVKIILTLLALGPIFNILQSSILMRTKKVVAFYRCTRPRRITNENWRQNQTFSSLRKLQTAAPHSAGMPSPAATLYKLRIYFFSLFCVSNPLAAASIIAKLGLSQWTIPSRSTN